VSEAESEEGRAIGRGGGVDMVMASSWMW